MTYTAVYVILKDAKGVRCKTIVALGFYLAAR